MSSVYIHIPFCAGKCPYCDFYSIPIAGERVPDRYVTALCTDIRRHLNQKEPLRSIFIGGGTPSLLSTPQVEMIVAALHDAAVLDSELEFSMEINPASTSPAWLEDIRTLGINRLSIGVQSFQDRALQLLGRRHTGAAALECIEHARSAGFDNISIDMMFALPLARNLHAGRACMEADQHLVAQIRPEHVSVYGLTLEPQTPFASQADQGLFVECDDEEFRYQFMTWHECLRDLGFAHYEISNYALSGRECRHNMAYWERRSCAAFGAGAHAFSAVGWGMRLASEADADAYVDTVERGVNPRHEVERFDAESAMAEWVYLRLRTARGVDEAEFRSIFGMEFAHVYADAIRSCGATLCHSEGRWHFPPQEWLLYNLYVQAFLL